MGREGDGQLRQKGRSGGDLDGPGMIQGRAADDYGQSRAPWRTTEDHEGPRASTGRRWHTRAAMTSLLGQ